MYTGFLSGNLTERRFGRPRRRWEDNTKKDLQEVGSGDMDWMIWLRIGTGGGNL